jgi:hypothetical protein
MKRSEKERELYIPYKFQNTYHAFLVLQRTLKHKKKYSNIDLNGVAKCQGIKCKQVWRCGDKN